MSLSFPSTDRTLVKGALQGNPDSLEALLLRYQRRAYAIARAVTLDHDGADDIVHEAFLLALQNLPKLRVHACFGPWFLQILRNVARRRLAPERLRICPEPGETAVVGTDPVEAEELRTRVWGEVGRLPVSVREAVFLYYHEGKSVRKVAKALEISNAAAKKRLQKGRELLRARLWSQLEECLRDMLPSARQWRRNGRRHTLVVLGALSASGGSGALAAAASAGGSSLASASSLASGSLLTLGGAFMLKKGVLASIFLFVLLTLGAAYLLRNPAGEKAGSDVAGESLVGRGELDEMERRYRKALGELGAAQRENRRLRRELGSVKATLAATEASAATHAKGASSAGGEVVKSGSGIDWSRLSRLVAENVDVIDLVARSKEKTPPGPEEQAKLMKLMSEMLRISAEARGITRNPFFDALLFDELTLAVFGSSLELNDEQRRALSAINRSLFEDLLGDVDSDELMPLERFALRGEISENFRSSLEELLVEDQLERWRTLSEFSKLLFQGGARVREYGLGLADLENRLVDDWKSGFSLRDDQLATVRPLVSSFVTEARELLQRYGKDQRALNALPPEERMRLEAELLQLQGRHERRIEPALDEQQLSAFRRGDPRIIRFRLDKNLTSSNRNGMF